MSEHATHEGPRLAVAVVTPQLSPRPDADEYVAAVDDGCLRFARVSGDSLEFRRPSRQIGDFLSVIREDAAGRVLPHDQLIVKRHRRVELVAHSKFSLFYVSRQTITWSQP